MKVNTTNIDQYILERNPEVREILEKIRKTIRLAAPNSQEAIKYGMPTFVLNGNLVHFAACKSHIGFYPSPSGILNFQDELSDFKCSKGAIQFPLDKPIPYELINQIVHFRVNENEAKIQSKSKKK